MFKKVLLAVVALLLTESNTLASNVEAEPMVFDVQSKAHAEFSDKINTEEAKKPKKTKRNRRKGKKNGVNKNC